MIPGNSTYLGSINNALLSLMQSDPSVLILGEDILDPYGGAFKVTSGLSSRFPERVFTTPISEAGFVGLSIGLAMRGFRPIVEIMFGDFVLLAADQLVNHAAKFRWMYGNEVSVPLVVRTPVGGRRTYGPTHSQSLEKHFIGVPGLWVVAPSILHIPGDLLKQASLDCSEPVLFIESKICYGKALLGNIPGMSARICRNDASSFPTIYLKHESGGGQPHGLLFCYGAMAPICLESIERLKEREGLFIDLAVLSQISPVPTEHIRSIIDECRSDLFIYAEEASVVGSWSSEIIASLEDIRANQTDQMKMKHLRVGGKFTPVPASRELEIQTLTQTENIVESIVSCF